jgi:hypothetical protein
MQRPSIAAQSSSVSLCRVMRDVHEQPTHREGRSPSGIHTVGP